MARQFPVDFSAANVIVNPSKKGIARLFWSTMRPYQWTKNFFVLAPLLFGRKLSDLHAVGLALAAFAVFSLLASGLYVINDCVDADEDRRHPEKCFRPISSGLLPVKPAIFGALILISSALATALVIGFRFFLVAAIYFALTVAYCFWLKKAAVLDCMTIAAGFVLRVIGGAIAVDVIPTHWLIVCAFLLALFLAFTKRRQEILTLSGGAADHREVLKEYSVEYLGQVNNILIGATIVCYALYTVAPETIEKFGSDKMIYGTTFVIYGIFRYLALIKDAENGGNPSKMLLRDKPLLLTVIGWTIYNALIIYQL
jgi:4-hydroxybenzoate polyprenyltransferase